MTAWLVVLLLSQQGVTKLVDEKQPDARTCWAKAAEAYDRYAVQTQHASGEYALRVACWLEHNAEDPA